MARSSRPTGPYSAQPRRGHFHADRWDVQRDVVLLTTQLLSERGALTTWQRRLALRVTYEQSHDGQSQLPVLRQACAEVHARVLDLEHHLADAMRQLRILRAREDRAGGSQG